MRYEKNLLLVVLLLIAKLAFGQTRTYSGKKLTPLRSYNNPSAVRANTGSSVPVFDEAGFPYQGIGIKVGDPVALTFRFYFSERIALSADFGRTLSGLYRSYYEKLFGTFYPDPLDTLTYSSHSVKTDWAGELKLLYYIAADDLVKGMRFYAGLGWQVRDTKLEYTWLVKEPAVPGEGRAQWRHQTQGVTGTIGTEFTNTNAPVIFFLEAQVFYDLDKDPGWMRLQGGVGVRYIF